MEYGIFDSDSHFYETEDAFTRFGSERVKGFVQWWEQGKRKHLYFGTQQVTGAAIPTFDPVAKPGILHETLKELQEGKRLKGKRFGELEPVAPEYQHREARLAVMDEQGIEKAIFHPTLGMSVEHLMYEDQDMLYDVFRAFNRWVDDQWGFSYGGRIYATPVIPLADVDRACAELDWALAAGARVVATTCGPAYGRSPADPYFNPFWARVNEAKAVVAYHAYAGPMIGYRRAFEALWMRPPVANVAASRMLASAIFPTHQPQMDTMLAMVLGGLFARFRDLRVASIEVGSSWVPYLLYIMDHTGGGLVERRVETFDGELVGRPSDIFKKHCFVSPFPEEDVVALAGLIGPSQVLFGSDWPHPECVDPPLAYLKYLEGMSDHDVKRIMRGNALALVEGERS
jgi:predicted TIM-barrel fold metal-dependent hydrolase